MVGYYGVKVGRRPGVYNNWEDCREQVYGYQGCEYRKFSSHAEAEEFVWEGARNIFTDGSCLQNGTEQARAGWGAYWGDSRDAYGPVTPATSNIAELTAIYKVLEQIHYSSEKERHYRIHTDSQYACNALTDWGNYWDSHGWYTMDGEPVKNRELIENTRTLLKGVSNRFGIIISLSHVKGHSGLAPNMAADRLARRGAALRPNDITRYV